jgi:diguanylate cyclase (GGDEF)-like protein
VNIVPQSAAAERLETISRTTAPSLPDTTVFDATTRIAAELAGVPMAVICLEAGFRHWVRSEFGPALRQAVQASSLHAAALGQDDMLIVPDASTDAAFCDEELVTGPWQIRFFASVKLRLRGRGALSDAAIGTLCLLDSEPRQLTETQLASLQDLARVIADQIELRLGATTDSLTGVYTRRYMGCYLEPEVARCRRHGNQLSAMVVDLDGFNAVNTTLGRAAGDLWIQAVTSTLRASVRFSDLVARVGGEEFLVILSETPAEGAALVAERTRGAIEALRLPYADAMITGTASFGVTTLTRQDQHVGDLLRRLDTALDKAKQAGRNRVVFEEG